MVGANVAVFWAIAGGGRRRAAVARRRGGVFAQAAIGTSMIAFGGLNWALDGAAAPVAAVLRLEPAMAPAGALAAGRPASAAGLPAREIRFRRRDVRVPASRARRCSTGSRPRRSRPARRWRSSARTARARRRWRSCLCRLYDPQSGCDRGRRRRPARPRRRVVAVAHHRRVPGLHPLRAVAARQRGAAGCARRRRPRRARATPAPTELADARHTAGQGLPGRHRSVGRPVAAGRAGPGAVRGAARAPGLCCSTSRPRSSTCAARRRSSTASWPPRATCTTILISHRFSTVRHADRICVLEHGRVVELGSHDELMALGGRYRTMFELQAQRVRATPRTRRGWPMMSST